MRLIDTSTLELVHFSECPSKQYAILSHTWEDDEVTFEKYHPVQARPRKGFWKIHQCCKQARMDGLRYAWIDTCCIDQKSSAELSEAINSMFVWYASSKICYVYLADIAPSFGSDVSKADFPRSRWFIRGWTLQELLAPASIMFYDAGWSALGTKFELFELISQATSIDQTVLSGKRPIHDFSIAQRMSWASSRTTTRTEDVAYSLLGLFQVNMPLLYGEGNRAFIRLQETIIQHSNDETVFAWTGVSPRGSGLFAQSPASFAQSHNIITDDVYAPRSPYFMTNRGISIQCRLLPCAMNTYTTWLLCRRNTSVEGSLLAMFVSRTKDDVQYKRISVHRVDLEEDTYTDVMNNNKGKPTQMYLSHDDHSKILSLPNEPVVNISWHIQHSLRQIHLNRIYETNHSQGAQSLSISTRPPYDCVTSKVEWNEADRIQLFPGDTAQLRITHLESGINAEITHETSSRLPFGRPRVGFDMDFCPVILLASASCTPAELETFENATLWSFDTLPASDHIAYGLIGGQRYRIDDSIQFEPDTRVQHVSQLQNLTSYKGHRIRGLTVNIVNAVGCDNSGDYEVSLSLKPSSDGTNTDGVSWDLLIQEQFL